MAFQMSLGEAKEALSRARNAMTKVREEGLAGERQPRRTSGGTGPHTQRTTRIASGTW